MNPLDLSTIASRAGMVSLGATFMAARKIVVKIDSMQDGTVELGEHRSKILCLLPL